MVFYLKEWSNRVIDTYSNVEVAEIALYEGLEYAVCEYLNPGQIEDEILKILWEEAKIALTNLQNFLKDYYERE